MPGSMGELKPLVLVVSCLGLFALLMTMIPGEFYASSYEGRQLEIPTYFDSVDVMLFVDTRRINLTENFVVDEFDFGGYHFEFIAGYADKDNGHIDIHRFDTFGIIKWWVGVGEWIGSDGESYGTEVYKHEMDINYDSEAETSKFTVEFGITKFNLFFAFNTTTYDKPSEAWEANDLYCLLGITFDQVNTSFNAWSIISGILFFQLPDVHPVINAIVAIPIWISIAYLIYVLILKAVPFVGG